jgi:dinuclear metal center YbgI/SA1388 family protein
MITQTQLDNFFTSFFGPEQIQKARKKDRYLANGLQLPGKKEIHKIVLGVSLTEDLIGQAIQSKADSVIIHHSLSLHHAYFLINQSLYRRLRLLIKNDLSVFGFHYLLDCDKRIGNNARIINLLGGKIDQPLFDEWGWSARLDKPQKRNVLAKKCAAIFNHDVFIINGHKEVISKIGVISGGGVPRGLELQEIVEANLDCYITGAVSEDMVGLFKELDINYFACGHYATEIFGVQALGLEIKKEFKDKVEVEFIDLPNPL